MGRWNQIWNATDGRHVTSDNLCEPWTPGPTEVFGELGFAGPVTPVVHLVLDDRADQTWIRLVDQTEERVRADGLVGKVIGADLKVLQVRGDQ